MPITITLSTGNATFANSIHPLPIKTVLGWLSSAGQPLDLIRGEGLMLAEFLGKGIHMYGLNDQVKFLADLKVFVYGSPKSVSAPSSSQRRTPESAGVFMAPPQTDTKKHAVERMDRQLRVFAIMALMKCGGLFDDAVKEDVELSVTHYQHGQGGIGDAAAHKIMATFTVKKKQLENIVTDQACKTFLIYFQAETSILKSCFNNADSEVETPIRNQLLALAQQIVTDPRLIITTTFSEFEVYVKAVWDTFRERYQQCCKEALGTSSQRMFGQAFNYSKRRNLLNIPVDQTMDAKRKTAEAALTTIVLDKYLKLAAETTECPIGSAEFENLYEIFRSARAPLPSTSP